MIDTPTELQILLKTLNDAKAENITVINVAEQTSITDYMIICTGRSSRHVKAIANQATVDMKSVNYPPLSQTGLDTGEWALVDFGDFILHAMQAETRSFYHLEGHWQS